MRQRRPLTSILNTTTNREVKFSVLGSGSWATAIVKMLLQNVDQVYWYIRSPDTLKYIRKHGHNPRYLSSVSFDRNKLVLSNNVSRLVTITDIIIVAVPSPYVKETLANLDLSGKKIVNCVKGLIPDESITITSYLKQQFNVLPKNLFMLSGPCHAEEVAQERMSYLTISNSRVKRAKELGQVFKSHFIRIRPSSDLFGAELASVLKNIYAIAVGIAHGMGYGDNFIAVLISAATREMKELIKELDKKKRDIDNSAYLGDLLVTAYSSFSRNRTFGTMLGKGYTVQSAFFEMTMIVEGYYATKGIAQIIKKIKFVPIIINAVYGILYENQNPHRVFAKLTTKLN